MSESRALPVEQSQRVPVDQAFELATVLDSVLDTARGLIPADAYAIWLLEHHGSAWAVAAGRGLSVEFISQLQAGPSEAMPPNPICADDVDGDARLHGRRAWYSREGIRSLMAVPIFIQEQRRGTLVFYFRTPHHFTDAETRLGTSLARLSSSALSATELYSEKKQAWAALERSEQNFRTVFETAACAIFIHDGSSVVYCNRAASEMLSMQPGETQVLWERIHPEDRAVVKARAEARLRGQAVPNRYELRMLRPGGSLAYIDLSAALIEYEGQRCILGTAFDITETRNAEEALRKTEKLAAAGRLAASIAHEINNPLESVTNLLYLLQQEEQLSTTGRDYLVLAEQELKRVSQIATQTLRFHRQSTKAGAVSLEEVLEAVHALYQTRLDRLRVVVERRYGHTAPIVAFEGELRQLFANLVANALDAMPRGGRLLLRTSPAVRADGVRGVRVTVADSGQGIDPELRGHVFEPFVTSKGMTGTGLGLWVSKQIVEKHRGSIRVRSRAGGLGSGTVFRLFLAESPLIAANEA